MVVGFLIARLRWSERTAVMQAELGTQKERLATTEKSLQETDSLRGENEQLGDPTGGCKDPHDGLSRRS